MVWPGPNSRDGTGETPRGRRSHQVNRRRRSVFLKSGCTRIGEIVAVGH